MKKENLRIVFMGTPDFAVASLRALVEGSYNIVAVITMPDKRAGRGYKIQYSPIKQYALEHEIRLLQPERLKNPEFIEALKLLDADLQIVVAFRMLPETVWNMPPLGTINLHGSLLPQYRGAAPINWAIINGETETGVTTFFLTHEIDTGQVIFQEKIPIQENDNVEIIHDKLMLLGAKLVCRTVDAILEKSVFAKPQNAMFENGLRLKSAPKIYRETCRIDWNQNMISIHNFVRGLSPYPTAWSELILADKTAIALKIYSTEKVLATHHLPQGMIKTDGKTKIDVATTDGFIRIISLQLSGKKRMLSEDFLRGFKLTEDHYFK